MDKKEVIRESHRIRSANRRAEIRRHIDEYKMGRPCVDCGGVFPPVCMDFHHTHGEKLFEMSSAVTHTRRLDKVILEMEKCVLICANCHRLRHAPVTPEELS